MKLQGLSFYSIFLKLNTVTKKANIPITNPITSSLQKYNLVINNPGIVDIVNPKMPKKV